MGNSIAKFKKCIDLLDEVYKSASKTSVLDGDASLVAQGANANEIIIPKMSMDGLADYDRDGGFVGGDVTLTNETVTCNFDRGRSFNVDAMDNEETAQVSFGKLSAEFIRTQVVPELDAFRFAQYTEKANSVNKKTETLGSGEAVQSAIIRGQNALDEEEVSEDGRILFITPSLYNEFVNLDTTKSREVLNSFAEVVKVPNGRFYSAITQKDGKASGETSGGFAKADGGVAINFMIVQKDAVIQYQKHTVSKVISPEENQDADAWKFCYRDYGIAEVYENKDKGIFVSLASE